MQQATPHTALWEFPNRRYDQCPSYYRARYYDPQVGRFINEDSIGFAAGLNFYRYVHNRPSTMIDPSGQVDVIHLEGIVIEPNVDADCQDSTNPRNETAGGCNKVNYGADYQCRQEPCSKSWKGHVTVTLAGDIYVSSGPYPYLGRPRAADRSVVDRASMIRHEQGHTADKLNAILPIFNFFESMSFVSEQECENAGQAAMIGAAARWAQAGVESQRRRQ
jgi:RHS repeat-associated protein